MAERAPSADVSIQLIGKDKDQVCAAVLCLKEDGAQVEEALRASGFAKLPRALTRFLQ